MWIGRVGSGIGTPCWDRAPEAGSIRHAVTWWLVPPPLMPDPLSVEATYRNFFDTCGHTYCTFAGALTVPRAVSAPLATSMSYCVISGPTAA